MGIREKVRATLRGSVGDAVARMDSAEVAAAGPRKTMQLLDAACDRQVWVDVVAGQVDGGDSRSDADG